MSPHKMVPLALCGLFLLSLGHTVCAETLPTFNVFDQEQQPVPDAVVVLPDTELALGQMPNHSAIMDQKDLQFAPKVLVIAPGTEVEFPNSDDTRHHVYSFSEAKSFELPLYSAAESHSELFDKSGIVKLGCNIHDDMRGYVYVAEHPVYGLSDDKGHVTLPDIVGELPAQIIVWHPQLSEKLIVPRDEMTANNNSNTLSLTLPFVLPSETSEKKASLKSRLKRYKSGR